MTSRNLTLKRGVSSLAAFALLAVAFVAVNVLAGVLPARLDVTEEGIYTLSEGSRRIVAGLEEPVTLKYFFTAGEDDIPVTLKTYATKVRELLRQFVSGSGGKVRLEVIDPRPDTDEEEWATRYGLSAGQLPTGGRLIHGLVVLSVGQEAIVPFFDSRREKFLEYDISEAVTRVTREAQEKLGLISFLPMMGQFDPRTRRLVGEWAVIQELRKMFQIEDLLRGDVAEIPADIKLVLVVHPRGLTSQVAYALDQFVVRGGRVIVLADPYSRHARHPREHAQPGSRGLPGVDQFPGGQFQPRIGHYQPARADHHGGRRRVRAGGGFREQLYAPADQLAGRRGGGPRHHPHGRRPGHRQEPEDGRQGPRAGGPDLRQVRFRLPGRAPSAAAQGG
jgi:hypothetical protein